jgi:hypothetical protein
MEDETQHAQFRRFAQECLRLAEGVQSIADKAMLLNMAQAWIQLAGQGHQTDRLIGGNGPQPP